MAKQAGALVVVDAAQSAPHRRLPVATRHVDAVVFSGHKMLAPTGTGVLWADWDLLQRLEPSALGGGTVDWVDTEGQALRKVPHRFEAGTPNIAGVFGLAAAIDYLDALGMDFVAAHDRALGRRLLDLALEREYLCPLGDDQDDDRAAVLSVSVPGAPRLADTARMLSDSYGVMCRSGHLCAQPLIQKLRGDGEVLRFSAYLYNTEDEIRGAFEALDEIAASAGLRPSVRRHGSAE